MTVEPNVPDSLSVRPSLAHGPHDPSTATPPRRPGSVRRTTTIDVWRPEVVGGPLEIAADGRDLASGSGGETFVRASGSFRSRIDDEGTVVSLESRGVPWLVELAHRPIRPGFRRAVDQAVGAAGLRGSPLHQLLDDLPVAAMVSGYGELREQAGMAMTSEGAEHMADLCAGWQRGATMMAAIDDTGILPTPVGPPAPALVDPDDEQSWHRIDPQAPGVLRRSRRIDVSAEDQIVVDAMFRDVHRSADGSQANVLHEYELSATIDRRTFEIAAVTATPRVLPWPECPRAAESATRLRGCHVEELRVAVLEELTGVMTCTHLNDALRALADVGTLAAMIADPA